MVDRPYAVGFCSEADLTAVQRYNVVTVVLDRPPLRPPAHRHDAISAGSSACGVCGHHSIRSALEVRPASKRVDTIPDDDLVRELPALLREQQGVFERTGGAHAAGLFDATGTALTIREDVGRHNAVDKVTGARVLAGLDPAATYLVVSGRAGFELVQKALAVGTTALVSVGAPTSLSVALAREGGLALYGFTSARRSVRYS
ncbi:formate dehydrogenase accessory sulfurtransferase FdhD [Nocardioides sp. LMS-CY]|uniref:formate dehydrogenase accessory sulfurtransferase FdhD n=1 Tax=Nocardioides sp. (strain LMS-CY) TaxID=2840457 RepID=UPI00207A5501|nr:formate dehydrogenase accessory sulfurtransferase FdhD [Nocardioides sp. LMS-CY]